MKKAIFFILLFAAAANLSAQTFTEWHDAAVNEINRLPMRASYLRLRIRRSRPEGATRTSRNASSTSTGRGNSRGCATPRSVPRTSSVTDFDDRAWGDDARSGTVGTERLRRSAIPQHRLRMARAIRKQSARTVPTTENHVGSYRREIEIPASWSDKQVIARFGSVTSNIYLWVNGRFVGYSEDSKLECRIRHHALRHARQEPHRLPGLPLVRRHLPRRSGLLPPLGRGPRLLPLCPRQTPYRRRAARRDPLGELHPRHGSPSELTLPATTRGCTAEVTLTDPDGKAVASRNGETLRYDSPSRARRRAGAAVVGGDSRALRRHGDPERPGRKNDRNHPPAHGLPRGEDRGRTAAQ